MKAADDLFYGHPDAFPLTVWRGLGVRAVDGDTVTSLVETEPHRAVMLDLRLSTIDTYELHSGPAEWRALAAEALAFTQKSVGGIFIRVISVLDTEKYGRTLVAIHYRTETGSWLDLAEQLDGRGFRKPVPLRSRRRRELDRAQRILDRAMKAPG